MAVVGAGYAVVQTGPLHVKGILAWLVWATIHLMYLANFFVDPFSLGGGFRGYLLLRRDGHATLVHDNRLPKSVEQAHVDDRRILADAEQGDATLVFTHGRFPGWGKVDREGPDAWRWRWL